MSKLKLALVFAIMSAFCIPALADEKVVKRVPAGAVAFHFAAYLSYSTGQLVGYIAFIEGVDGDVDGDLFAGPPSKDTAYFTLRLTEFPPGMTPLPVEPGIGVSVSMLKPGARFEIYYNPNPISRDWNEPDTFAEGVPIAEFEESALLGTGAAGASFNVFSSRLIDSTPIDFNGQKIDFKKLVPNGVTTTNFATPRPDFLGAGFGATAIAIGGKLRDKSDD